MISSKRVFHSFAIVAPRSPAARRAAQFAETLGFLHDQKTPDFVLSYGGDGTLLHAERSYPSVPKLLVRDSHIGKAYSDHSLEDAFLAVKRGAFHLESHMKLEARITRKGKTTIALGLNDIIIRNADLSKAIRFDLVAGKNFPELIGDGLVIPTPFGSGAYFHSITRRSFARGFGVAFNNLTVPKRPLFLAASARLAVRIVRGPVDVAADNFRLRFRLLQGDRILVVKAKETACLIVLS